MEGKTKMLTINSERFGNLEVTPEQILHFETGLYGFPEEREFVFIPHGDSNVVAWLQSATSPGMALPVVSPDAVTQGYPDVPLNGAAERAGLVRDDAELAVLAVLCAPPNQPPTVNLLAPIVIDMNARKGAQIVLEQSRFRVDEPLPPAPDATETATTEGG
jgi:flagellar assembly factor FliW